MEATATLNRYSTATLRSGKVAVVDNSTRRNLVVLVGTPAEAAEFVADYNATDAMCECEQDWNCPLHGGTSRPTWIETRWETEQDDPSGTWQDEAAYAWWNKAAN